MIIIGIIKYSLLINILNVVDIFRIINGRNKKKKINNEKNTFSVLNVGLWSVARDTLPPFITTNKTKLTII
tara:strand:+ start:75 stop:287 length:213 start_codon:yes stop_codon:yes gene_type:complete